MSGEAPEPQVIFYHTLLVVRKVAEASPSPTEPGSFSSWGTGGGREVLGSWDCVIAVWVFTENPDKG